MSLIVAISVPQGIVLGADSRSVATLQRTRMVDDREEVDEHRFVNSDASEKLFFLSGWLGVGVWGDLFIGNQEVGEYLRAFEREHLAQGWGKVEVVAQKIASFFRALEPIPDISMLLTGFEKNTAQVWSVEVRTGAVQRQIQTLSSGKPAFGVVRGGDTQIVDRLLADPRQNPKFDIMTLQTAADFTRHLINTAIAHSRYEPVLSTIGGPVDLLLMTRRENRFLQKKTVH